MKNTLALFVGFLLCVVSVQGFSQTFKQNDKVEIDYNGSWYPGYIMETKGDQYKIHYDNYTDSWDEWVPATRLKAIGGSPANKANTKVAEQKKKEGAQTKKEAAGTNTTAAKTAPKEIVLKEATNDKIGFSIMIPEKAKEEESPLPDVVRFYTLILPGGLSITVKVGKVIGEMASLEDAVRDATQVGQKDIKEQTANGSDFLVVKQPQGVMQEFRYYAKTSSEEYIFVECSGPSTQETICMKIINSLKATK